MINYLSSNKEKNSLWKRISNFFKSIFFKNRIKEIEDTTRSYEINPIEKSKSNFWKNIRIEEELEDKELLELQRKFINKEISMNELTEQQISDLTALYKRQTERILRKTEQIKAETEIINAKIARLKGQIPEE